MANRLDLGNFTLTDGAVIRRGSGQVKLVIDDEGDGGYLSFAAGIPNNTLVDTSITIDSIDSHRVRWDIGGQVGTWRSAADVDPYEEAIGSAASGYARIVWDPFTQATIDWSTLSVE